jgi:hypothetical protein
MTKYQTKNQPNSLTLKTLTHDFHQWKTTKPSKVIRLKTRKQKPKNSMENRPKQPKLKNLFFPSFWHWEILSARKKRKKKKKKEIKNKRKSLWFWAFLPRERKTQTFSPINLIVIKTFVPSTRSIIDQKPKTKTLPQKQAKTTVSWKPFLSFILTLGDSISLEKKKKKKKKKLKTSEKAFDFEPFCQEKRKLKLLVLSLW